MLIAHDLWPLDPKNLFSILLQTIVCRYLFKSKYQILLCLQLREFVLIKLAILCPHSSTKVCRLPWYSARTCCHSSLLWCPLSIGHHIENVGPSTSGLEMEDQLLRQCSEDSQQVCGWSGVGWLAGGYLWWVGNICISKYYVDFHTLKPKTTLTECYVN